LAALVSGVDVGVEKPERNFRKKTQRRVKLKKGLPITASTKRDEQQNNEEEKRDYRRKEGRERTGRARFGSRRVRGRRGQGFGAIRNAGRKNLKRESTRALCTWEP